MNFLFNASCNFKGFYQNGFKADKIDLKDLIIISYLNYWQGRSQTKKKNNHFWVNRESMLKNLPYLGIGKVDTLSKRFTKLDNLGLLTRIYNSENGDLYIRLTNLCLDCINGQKEMENHTDIDQSTPPRSKSGNPPRSRSGNPPDLDLDYYIDQDHKDHIKLKEKEKHAMLCTLWGAKSEPELSGKIFSEVCKTNDDFENILKSAEWYISTQPEYKYKKRLSRWLKNKEFNEIMDGLRECGQGNKCSRCVYRHNANCTPEKRKSNLYGENCGSWIEGEPESKTN